MMEEGVEHPHTIKAMRHQLLELRPDNLQLLVLPASRAPRLALLPLRPPTGERREWHLYRVPDVEPFPVPPSIGITGGVRGVRTRYARFLLQHEAPHQCDHERLPLQQSSPREHPLKEVQMWLHPKEGLAHDNKANDMQHPSRIEVLQFQAPLIEELA